MEEQDKNTNTEHEDQEMITISKADLNKKIQSESDKVRTTYSKQIADLKAKLPVEKTEAELAIEKRIAALEDKEREAVEKAKVLDMQAKLTERSLDKDLAAYLKADADLEKFAGSIEALVNKALTKNGYVPNEHPNNKGLTYEEYNKLDYADREKAYEANPTYYDNLLKDK